MGFQCAQISNVALKDGWRGSSECWLEHQQSNFFSAKKIPYHLACFFLYQNLVDQSLKLRTKRKSLAIPNPKTARLFFKTKKHTFVFFKENTRNAIPANNGVWRYRLLLLNTFTPPPPGFLYNPTGYIVLTQIATGFHACQCQDFDPNEDKMGSTRPKFTLNNTTP